MKRVNVLIVRDPMMTIPKTVGEHEVPVLQAIHGTSGVQVESDAGDAETPDPHAEYNRLAQTYGIDAERKQHYVEIVYGRGPAQLAAAMGVSRKRGSAKESATADA